jgi:hypothetical protein
MQRDYELRESDLHVQVVPPKPKYYEKSKTYKLIAFFKFTFTSFESFLQQ